MRKVKLKLMPEKQRKSDRGPLRTCVICRKKFAQDELERYVSSQDGYEKGRTLQGRGVYVCRDERCREKFFARRKVRR